MYKRLHKYPDIENVLQRITYQSRIVKNILLYKPSTFNKYQNCAQTFVYVHYEPICSVSMVYGNDGDSFYNQVGKCYDSIRQYMYFARLTILTQCNSTQRRVVFVPPKMIQDQYDQGGARLKATCCAQQRCSVLKYDNNE